MEADRHFLMRLQMLPYGDRHTATAQVAHAPPVRLTTTGQQDIDARQEVVAWHPPPLPDHRPDRLQCWFHFLPPRESPGAYSSFRAEIVSRLPVSSTNWAGVRAPRRLARSRSLLQRRIMPTRIETIKNAPISCIQRLYASARPYDWASAGMLAPVGHVQEDRDADGDRH